MKLSQSRKTQLANWKQRFIRWTRVYHHSFRPIGTGQVFRQQSSFYKCAKCGDIMYVPLGMEDMLITKGCDRRGRVKETLVGQDINYISGTVHWQSDWNGDEVGYPEFDVVGLYTINGETDVYINSATGIILEELGGDKDEETT